VIISLGTDFWESEHVLEGSGLAAFFGFSLTFAGLRIFFQTDVEIARIK
jgi:hypothetical protein